MFSRQANQIIAPESRIFVQMGKEVEGIFRTYPKLMATRNRVKSCIITGEFVA
jgi:hypothetical protein